MNNSRGGSTIVGTTISHYKVIEKIGQGGMGEVFLAQDTTLDRKVALKFLPEEMQQDSTAKKRFLREAKSAAALDHPYICHIHEVGEVEGQSFISMEYVQGETLKDKLAKGPLLLNDALEKATEVAEALEEAHKQGIVHRDLKPSNIMLTPQGHVKVMDFGLAKRVTTAEGQEQDITTALTKQGSTLGTVPYMSPEQVRGQVMDTRSDIFSFGVVLYEMLTGVNPFKGDTSVDTSHAILGETPPPLTRYTEEIPVLLQHTVKKMLAKEPDQRYQLIHDVRTDLGELREDSGDSIRGMTTGVPSIGGWKRAITWSITAAVIAIAGWALWSPTVPTSKPLTKVVIITPDNAPLADSRFNQVAISPDGRTIVYQARVGGGRQLYLRQLDDLGVTPLSGTEDVLYHFFSPDGDSVAFSTLDALKKISLTGGPAITLIDDPGIPANGSWGPNDTIVFTIGRRGSPGPPGLYRVSANGGEPEGLAFPDADKGEISYRFPSILPDGKDVLFTIRGREKWQGAVLSLETGEQKIVLEGARQARYAATGHLVYVLPETGNLMAVSFDVERLEVSGSPVPILEGVRRDLLDSADYTFSSEGTLVYILGSEGSRVGAPVWVDPDGEVAERILERSLVWVDRGGAESLVTEEKREYENPRLSPDGKKVALGIQNNVWIYDLERHSLSRLTFEGEVNRAPIWEPDGQWITFRSTREDGASNLYRKRADGSGPMERLTTSPVIQGLASWSPDGSVLSFFERRPEGGQDIFILPKGSDTPQLLVGSPALECCLRFSPDSKWFAYVSNELGQDHIYVRPYPEGDGKWLVSDEEGGGAPVWAPDGSELFYRSGNRMMVVAVEPGPTFKSGRPEVLFEGSYAINPLVPGFQYYDISPDGQRFLMVKPSSLET